MDDYLPKPFEEEYFIKILKKWLLEQNRFTSDRNSTVISGAINENKFSDVRSLVGEKFNPVIHDYFNKIKKLSEEIDLDFTNSNYKKIQTSLHSIKSSSAFLGFERMNRACKNIEELLLASSPEKINFSDLYEIKKSCSEIEDFLRQELEEKIY